MGLHHVHHEWRQPSVLHCIPPERHSNSGGAGGERREKENARVGVIDPRRPWTPEDVEHFRAFSRTLLITVRPPLSRGPSPA
jgi:hypothetical protein